MEYVTPSKDFSLKTGIYVYTDWELPYEETSLNKYMAKLMPVADTTYSKEIEKLWNDFSELYPQINNWITKTDTVGILEQKADIMFGMVSKYNENDIREYLRIRGTNRDEHYNKRVKNITNAVGFVLGWIPSNKTIDYIESQLGLSENIKVFSKTQILESLKNQINNLES